jgi:integrase
MKEYAEEAGIAHFHLHQTRHTYARILFEDSGDVIETQSALDHDNQATTRAYIHTIAVEKDKHGDRIARRTQRTDRTSAPGFEMEGSHRAVEIILPRIKEMEA